MNYAFSVATYINDILPVILRQPKIIAYLKALLSGVKLLHTELLAETSKHKAKLAITSETQLFEYYLNQEFNQGGNEITIENISNGSPALYVGYPSEIGHNVFVGYTERDLAKSDVFVGYDTEQETLTIDFIVHVPSGFFDNVSIDAMNAFIRQYAFAGRRFAILDDL